MLPVVFALLLAPQSVLVEAEGFEQHGGWVLDQQFMDQMGSPFLLAHGLGVPVADAQTTVRLPAPGSYRVWVRTRDWVAPHSPGRFQLLIGGRPLAATFGAGAAGWHWQDGGTIRLGRDVQLRLHDLTGFDGRCDAILFSRDPKWRPPEGAPLAAFRRQSLGLPARAPDAGAFDLVVVGGGMAGTATAISAARHGLRVALVQDRPVLGGNNSSEVRVHLGGKINLEPYPALGAVVAELDSGRAGNAQPAANYDDEKKLAVVRAERNIRLFLNQRGVKVEMNGARIAAVIAADVRTGREMRYTAPLFADCTGDGAIGALAGADFRVGRESRAETGESLAPETADRMVMGASIMWYGVETDKPAPFPECPWAVPFDEANALHALRGDWNWETGLNRDQVADAEAIRDYGLRAAFGNWAFLKNRSTQRAKYERARLEWVAYVAGKRESRRLLGDVILREQDVVNRVAYPDASFTTTWTIDLHYPEPKNSAAYPGQEFRTIARHVKIEPYAVPYRCLYSRNIANLFMAGRNISVTHAALGTVRVMRTTGMMGEVVGMAAAVARRHNTTPRGVYRDHLEELKALLRRGAGK
ncbi:MAG: FAD-dependent oxidoreductase [Bryobacteraceae bacterium]